MFSIRSKIAKAFSASVAMIVSAMMPAAAQAAQLQTPLIPTNNASIVLNYNDSVVSRDGRFRFIFQADGNLVLHQGTTALWDSGTTPHPYTVTQPGGPYTGGGFTTNFITYACIAQFQADGNLVVLGASGLAAAGNPCPGRSPAGMTVLWSSNTYPYPGARLEVQDDGNVVIYDASLRARWSTRTCCR